MQKKDQYNVAVVGATGAVGVEMLKVLEKRAFPVGRLKLLASRRSVGKTFVFKGKDYPVEELTGSCFDDIDIAFFSAGGDRAKEFAPAAVRAGAVVIDNSSAFRMDPKVPLVVPEVNPDTVKNHNGIIANPNCTTIIMTVALSPIHKVNPIKRIVVASYQAVSGAGARAVAELKQQQRDLMEGRKPRARIFKHVIADNVFSHDSPVLETGYNLEETKMINETHKIFASDAIQVSPTCVRVPIYRVHSEAIHLELSGPADLEAIRSALKAAPGIKIVDHPESNYYPMPIDATGCDEVLVGRIRRDTALKNGLNLFVCGDQLLKGAALNAVQIAELLCDAKSFQ